MLRRGEKSSISLLSVQVETGKELELKLQPKTLLSSIRGAACELTDVNSYVGRFGVSGFSSVSQTARGALENRINSG